MHVSFLVLLAFLIASCESTLTKGQYETLQVFEGVFEGYFSALDANLEYCVTDGIDVIDDLRIGVQFIEKWNKSGVTTGMHYLGEALVNTVEAVENCKSVESDIVALGKLITQVFVDPEDYAFEVGMNILAHGFNIYDDIKNAVHAFQSGNYNSFGRYIGQCMKMTLGATMNPTWPQLTACQVVPTTDGRVTLPADISSIREGGFQGCADVQYLNFHPSISLTDIHANAFQGSGLIEAALPPTVVTIEESAFADIPTLTKISFGTNSQLQSIEKDAFTACPNLNHVMIPKSVLTIGDRAFSGCKSLNHFTFECDSKAVLSSLTFSPCDSESCGLYDVGMRIPSTVTYEGSDVTTTTYTDPPVCPSSKPPPSVTGKDESKSATPKIGVYLGACAGTLFLALMCYVWYSHKRKQEAAANAASMVEVGLRAVENPVQSE